MVDIVDRKTRSRMMAAVRSKNTKPELAVRRRLHQLGLRFRLHSKTLPGSPDLSFPKYGTAVFVHGCFWHRHQGCKDASRPKSNSRFWENKLLANVRRDKKQRRALQSLGWKVLTIWECEISERALARIAREVRRGAKSQTLRRRQPDDLGTEPAGPSARGASADALQSRAQQAQKPRYQIVDTRQSSQRGYGNLAEIPEA